MCLSVRLFSVRDKQPGIMSQPLLESSFPMKIPHKPSKGLIYGDSTKSLETNDTPDLGFYTVKALCFEVTCAYFQFVMMVIWLDQEGFKTCTQNCEFGRADVHLTEPNSLTLSQAREYSGLE